MMQFLPVLVIVVSTVFLVVNAASDTGGDGTPSSGASRLADGVNKTYCEYKHYRTKNFYCTDLPPAEAKIDCEKKAEEKHKEKLECWCTDDPDTIRVHCKK